MVVFYLYEWIEAAVVRLVRLDKYIEIFVYHVHHLDNV